MSNTERGFIALARGVLDHPVVGARKPHSDFEAWVWLLLEAVWKPRRIRATNGRAVGFLDLRRGQLSYSHSFLRKAWGWSSEKRVRTFLHRLETDGQIDLQTGHLQTVITICNYERYQNPEASKRQQAVPQTEPQRTSNGPEEEQGNKTIVGVGRDQPIREWQGTEAYKLAKQISVLAGQAEEFEFTGWSGAVYRVQKWLDAGWPPELILSCVKELAAKKQGRPPRSVKYFEAAIAEAIVRQNTPLPQTNERNGHGNSQKASTKSGNVVDASRRLVERMRSLNRDSAVCSRTDEPVVRLLPKGGRQ